MRGKTRPPGWWDRFKAIARLRHELKVWIGRFFVVDKGNLATSHYGMDVTYFGDVDRPGSMLSKDVDDRCDAPHHEGLGRGHSDKRRFVCVIENAHLVGPTAVPLTHDRKIIAEHLDGLRDTVLRHKPYRHILQSLGRADLHLAGALSINGPYCHNYYHWFMDCLPCLYGFEEYRAATQSDCALLVPSYLFDWQKRSLELLGYGGEAYLQNGHKHVRVDRLVVPSAPRANGFDEPPPRLLLSWLRERLMAPREPAATELPKRIHISRADSAKPSRIGNEAEVAAALARLGFSNVVLRDFSLDDQINMFAEAEIVVATHGAGLTNLIYAQRPKVLELFPSGLISKHFYHLSNYVGGAYQSMTGKAKADGSSEINVADLVGTVGPWV